MSSKAVLEILVDKQNEKWAWVFEHILIILHKSLEKKPKMFEKSDYKRPSFSFEIVKIWNKIRFFLVTDESYKNYIKNQIYAHYNNVEIYDINDYLDHIPDDKISVWKVWLEKHFYYPIKNFVELQEKWANSTIDPYGSITSSLIKTWRNTLNWIQINFSPIWDDNWKKDKTRIITILTWKQAKFIKKFLLKPKKMWFKILTSPFVLLGKLVKKKDVELKDEIFKPKLALNWFWVDINIFSAWEDLFETKGNIKEIFSTLWVFSMSWSNWFKLWDISNDETWALRLKSRKTKDSAILSTWELAWLVHLPTNYVKTPWINWVIARNFEPPASLPVIDDNLEDDFVPETNLTPLWKTNFRWTDMTFGIWPSDRRRHIYIIWKTWMGKSTLLENMIIDDIKKWRWVAVIDPHGDLAEHVIWHIPKARTNQAIIFDATDTQWPISFNMLEDVSPDQMTLVASWIVGIFKRIFGNSWWPRLEHILRNTILALLEYPNSTLMSVPLMLTSEVFRNKVVARVKDPVVKKFWTAEFAKMSPNQMQEAISPILNKVGQFLSSSILRNILGQSKNTFSMRWAMDNEKIVIINLSKWKIWEDASKLLWAMMVTKFQIDAMARADMKEDDRKDFYLYVDEFQNFATDSFATILSEARKYKLNLVMANQYIDQMSEEVRWAVFWNVWSTICFQVGSWDAKILKEVMSWWVTEEDLTNLKKYSIYLKQLIEWMPSPVFSADTLAPEKMNPEAFDARYNKILNVSREKYAKPRDMVDSRIVKMMKDLEDEENQHQKKKDEYANKMKEEKAKKHAEMLEKQTKKE